MTELERCKVQVSHLEFIKYTWQNPNEACEVGLHTREICRQIDIAMNNLRKGKSTFLIVKVPFRHGKSYMLSRTLPPHFLGEFPDDEVMIVTYNQSVAEDFSRYARNLILSDEYKDIYPNIQLSFNNSGVQKWGIERHLGSCMASGLTSGITGKGYVLGLCDDYCSSRADAESSTIRNSTWEHFTNDFLTRRAPVSITIVLATPWHVDDIIGRIEQRINPESDKYEPDFPKFKILSFPAINGDVEVGEYIKGVDNRYHEVLIRKHYDYLFPQRFSEEWYKQQFASLGSYASSALLQCNPQQKGGNLIDTSKIKFHDNIADFPQTRYFRMWDLAHTAKQTQKNDPDWTSGTLLTYTKIAGVWHLWIKDVARIRAKAPERNNFILAVTQQDGMNVPIVVENSMDSKDAVSDMQNILSGKRMVKPINIRYDKVARVGYVEPIFEAGNVHVLRAEWNRDWLEEVKAFPSGKHDDQVDNITAGYFECCQGSEIIMGRVSGI